MKNSRFLAILLVIFVLLASSCTSDGQDESGNVSQAESSEAVCGHEDADRNEICDICFESVIITVDFYVINDLHGKIADTDTQPGVDELTTYFKRLQNSEDNLILLSAGDSWQGSSESNMTQGLLTTEWMNEVGFSAMTLGNHEYDWGEAPIELNSDFAQFPLLAINVYDPDTHTREEYCKSSVMLEVSGLKIGVIGAMGDCYSSIAADKTEDVYFIVGDELTELVKAESDSLRMRGADFIVYILHDGLGESKGSSVSGVSGNEISYYYDIALSNGYVDLVFEAHTHQKYILRDTYGVYHLQNRGENQGISHVEVQINAVTGVNFVTKTELIDASAYSWLIDDPLVDELLDKYSEQLAPSYEELGHNRTRRNSSTIKQYVADLYYDVGIDTWGDEYDIALGGGYISVRSPYELPVGTVTYAQLHMLLPFDNQIVLCSIKGSDLKNNFFESSNSNYYISYGEYGASIRNSIDPNKTYYIVTDTYSALYKPNRLTEIARLDETTFARDLLADYIRVGGLS